ncbi:Lipopolysaccharide biosynthesis protein RfbH [Trichinella britovi]|uniref:Lipopolysaccharide biosynthesis protein RfbH n=1 Tax=Trichinella britovi TaxID=45882 RepID=A0A0V1CCS5_TRIBR|nr:Lipopolysaccharide biosynthesis protein RfbH [Trichinella britovi]
MSKLDLDKCEATDKMNAVVNGNCDWEHPVHRILQETMEKRRTALMHNGPYWHPLSVPTYGVDEVMNCLDSLLKFQTTMGPKVKGFERNFAKAIGVRHAVMVNSGSSADLLCSMALTMASGKMLNPGDEILVPALTWPTQIWSPLLAKLNVQLVDVDPVTLNTTPEIVEKAIGPKTKALFIVHLMGNVTDMDRMVEICNKHNLILLEDCCESLGAKYRGRHVGTFGLAGAFSFFFAHHIVTMEGGMVVTNDDQFADNVRVLRAHGWTRDLNTKFQNLNTIDPRFLFIDSGFNLRPTELSGAFGEIQLQRMPIFLKRRLSVYEAFSDYISKHLANYLSMPKVHDHVEPSWFSLPILINIQAALEAGFTKKDLIDYLEKAGIETRPVLIGDIRKQPVAEHFQFIRDSHLPGVEYIDNNAFVIGLHSGFKYDTEDQVQLHINKLCQTFQQFFQNFLT